MVCQSRLELETYGLRDRRSDQLSYWRIRNGRLVFIEVSAALYWYTHRSRPWTPLLSNPATNSPRHFRSLATDGYSSVSRLSRVWRELFTNTLCLFQRLKARYLVLLRGFEPLPRSNLELTDHKSAVLPLNYRSNYSLTI